MIIPSHQLNKHLKQATSVNMRTSAFLAVPAFAAIALAQTVSLELRLEPLQSMHRPPMLDLVL
jgi:hypothetical protein